MAKTNKKPVVPIEHIAEKIYVIRDQKVMIDSDLADLYGVTTKILNQAVKRNIDRFPEDFMFQLTDEEFENLRSQIVTSSWGGRRYPPYTFTEQGVAMLSSVIRSQKATQINIAIMRAFVRLREMLATHPDVVRKLEEHDRQIASLYDHVQKLLQQPSCDEKPIGYIWPEDEE